MTERNERTSPEIMEIAGRLANHPDPDVRRVAMSALTQGRDKEQDADVNQE